MRLYPAFSVFGLPVKCVYIGYEALSLPNEFLPFNYLCPYWQVDEHSIDSTRFIVYTIIVHAMNIKREYTHER